MVKHLFLMMDYGTFMKWQLLAIGSGALLGWACGRWERDYREAKEAGVVA